MYIWWLPCVVTLCVCMLANRSSWSQRPQVIWQVDKKKLGHPVSIPKRPGRAYRARVPYDPMQLLGRCLLGSSCPRRPSSSS